MTSGVESPSAAPAPRPSRPAAQPAPPARPRPRDLVAEAWRERALVAPMGSRVIRKTIAKTKLGFGWILLRPVLDTAGKALIFGSVIGVSAAPQGVPYFLFLLIGMVGWRLFDQTLFWGTRGFDRYAKLVRRFSLPLLLVPVAASAFAWLEFAIYAVILVVSVAVLSIVDGTLHLQLGPELALGLLGLVLALALGIGLALWLSVLNARWRDVRLSLRYVMEIWLYITPVIYPLTQLPESVRPLAQVNPMAPIVELVKEGFLGVGTVSAPAVAWAAVAAVGSVASGLWFFARHAAAFTLPQATVDDDEDEETP